MFIFTTGCNPSRLLGVKLFNSRNFNIKLETNSGTCLGHRTLRELERQHLRNISIKPKHERLLKNRIENVAQESNSSKDDVYSFGGLERSDESIEVYYFNPHSPSVEQCLIFCSIFI